MAKHYRFGSGIKVVIFSSERQKRSFMDSFHHPNEKSPYQITFGEKELNRLPRQEKKRMPGRISYLSFFGGFVHSLKVKDYLALNKKNMDDEKVKNILKDYQLEGLLNTKIYLLKEEEKKRVLLSQVALSFYDILFVDDSLLEKYGIPFIDEMIKLVSSDKLVFFFTDKNEALEGHSYPLIDLDQEEYTDSSIRMISDYDAYPGIGYRSLLGTLSDKRFRLRWLLIPLFVLSTLTVAVFSAGMSDSSDVYLRTYEDSKEEVIALQVNANVDIDDTAKKISKKANTVFYPAIRLDSDWYDEYYLNSGKDSDDIVSFWNGKFKNNSLACMLLEDEPNLPDCISLVAGSLPNNDDEVMLTDYQLQYYLRNGMQGFNGQPTITAEEIVSDVSCVVGHEIQFSIDRFDKAMYKISGVLNTGFQEDRYKNYLSIREFEHSSEEARAYDFLTNYSFSNVCYVSRNIYSSILEESLEKGHYQYFLIGKAPTTKSSIKYLAKLDHQKNGLSYADGIALLNPYAYTARDLLSQFHGLTFDIFINSIALTVLCAILWIVFFCFYFDYVGMGWNYLRINKYSLLKLIFYPILLALIPMILSLLIGAPLGVSTIAIFNHFLSKPYFSYGLSGVLWALLSSVSIYLFSLMIAWIISLRKLKN